MSEEHTPIVHETASRKVSSVSACEWDDEDYPTNWEIQYYNGVPLSTVVTTKQFVREFTGVPDIVDVENPHQ